MLAPACDSSSNDDASLDVPSSSDPRCAALCIDEPPMIDGAYDVCSAQSTRLCVDLCEQRIEETDNICAECLLEDARFNSPSGEDFTVCGDDGMCYVGLTSFCEDGCWFDDSGGYCDEGDSCDGAEVQYQEQVNAGEACAYPQGDDVARAACHTTLHPREEVTCDVEFDTVTACTDVCG